MARKGRAGPALAIAALGSFFAGTVATFLIALFAPPLTAIALQVRPGRIFLADGARPGRRRSRWRTARSSRRSAMIVLGLLLGLVGTDIYTGTPRFTFGIRELADGLELRRGRRRRVRHRRDPAQPRERARRATSVITKVSGLMPTREDLRRMVGADPARHRARLGARHPAGRRRDPRLLRRLHDREEGLADTPSEFGKGAIEGVAGAGSRPTMPARRPRSSRC